ncbi:unnamed protein product [Gadus morhua 'NCC']
MAPPPLAVLAPLAASFLREATAGHHGPPRTGLQRGIISCEKKHHEVEVLPLVTDEQGPAANQSKDNGDMTSQRKGIKNLATWTNTSTPTSYPHPGVRGPPPTPTLESDYHLHPPHPTPILQSKHNLHPYHPNSTLESDYHLKPPP